MLVAARADLADGPEAGGVEEPRQQVLGSTDPPQPPPPDAGQHRVGQSVSNPVRPGGGARVELKERDALRREGGGDPAHRGLDVAEVLDVLEDEPAVDEVRVHPFGPRLVGEPPLGVVDVEALAVLAELLQHRGGDVDTNDASETAGHGDEQATHAAAVLDGQVTPAQKVVADLVEQPRRGLAARLEEPLQGLFVTGGDVGADDRRFGVAAGEALPALRLVHREAPAVSSRTSWNRSRRSRSRLTRTTGWPGSWSSTIRHPLPSACSRRVVLESMFR